MSGHTFPPQDLDCPDPAGCPVAPPEAIAEATRTALLPGEEWFRCYDVTWGYDEPNPVGDARFSPFDDLNHNERVAAVYLSRNRTGALLESVFHDVEPNYGHILVDTLRQHNLVHVLVPKPMALLDLRDEQLNALNIDRSAIASSSSEHYPCTRRIARAAHATGVDGIIWHSRQAEFHRGEGRDVDPVEVAVIFEDHANIGRGGWQLAGGGSQHLTDDTGRLLVDKIATALGVVVIDES
jgi:hypothetical protein